MSRVWTPIQIPDCLQLVRTTSYGCSHDRSCVKLRAQTLSYTITASDADLFLLGESLIQVSIVCTGFSACTLSDQQNGSSQVINHKRELSRS
jgi:hypothetical protein